MARLLGVSRSGYYAWLDRPPSARAEADAALLQRGRTVHVTSRRTYGAPRVHAELRARGARHGRKRIARLMRNAGLVGAGHRRGGPATTQRDENSRPAPDLVDRNFTASGPNQLWVADMTFIPTAAGFPYLAVVLDVWSREVVDWATANHLRTELVLDAQEMALGQRRPRDVIHHSDQGSQYTSLAFGKRCREAGVRPSMGSVGDAYDNALCGRVPQRGVGALRLSGLCRGVGQARLSGWRLEYRSPRSWSPGSCSASAGWPTRRTARGGARRPA
jgi:putative transposase